MSDSVISCNNTIYFYKIIASPFLFLLHLVFSVVFTIYATLHNIKPISTDMDPLIFLLSSAYALSPSPLLSGFSSTLFAFLILSKFPFFHHSNNTSFNLLFDSLLCLSFVSLYSFFAFLLDSRTYAPYFFFLFDIPIISFSFIQLI